MIRWVALILPALCGPALAKGISGNVYYLGVALDQEGAAGGWAQVGGDAEWKATTAGTIRNGALYTTESAGGLFVTELSDGTWRQLGKPDFAATKFLFSAGENLYTIASNGNLVRVDPATGARARVGAQGDWKNTIAAAVLNDRLFSAEADGILYCTNLADGTWQQIGNADFAATRFMLSERNSLYTIETDGTLYRVSPIDGSWAPIGERGAWKGAVGACVLAGRLYTAEKSGKLFSADLQSGRRNGIGNADFGATRFMFPAGGNLYTIEDSGNLYRVTAHAGELIDAFDCFPKEFDTIFHNQGTGLSRGFQSRTVTGTHATRAGILDGLAWLDHEAGPDDLAIVYLTAHGGTDPKTGWSIATADMKTLHARELKAALGKLRSPVLLLLETCECGGFAAAHENDPPVPANATAICACGAGETTNNPLDIAACEALYGRADFNGDGVVDLDELVRYIPLRYKDWWPTPGNGTNEPVIVRGKNVSGSLELTHGSKQVIAIAVGDDLWSALDQGTKGNTIEIHLLGWPADPGKPYYITNTTTREHICTPADGTPVQVHLNGHWRPARLLKGGGKEVTVEYIDDHPGKETVDASRVRYPFAGHAP
jgi:hypothetical protein